MLTLIALIAALLCFGLTQFVDKKMILVANVTGNFIMHLYLMAVCSLPPSPSSGKFLIRILVTQCTSMIHSIPGGCGSLACSVSLEAET